MGTLIGPDGQIVHLMPHHTVGRNPSNALVVPQKEVSNAHAEITWTVGGWVLLDMSSNGTFLDHRKARSGVLEPICKGTEISFAGSSWRMVGDEPPQPMARELHSGALVRGEHNTLFLPDADNVLVCVALTASGWLLERAGSTAPEPEPADHEQQISLGGQTWVLHLPVESVDTVDSPELLLVEDLTLQASHSLDMEHVRLTLLAGARDVSLQPRAHHHTLFALASERLADLARGVAAGEAGWRSRAHLAQLAGVERNTLDQHLFRARKEIAALGLVYDADALIERRPGGVRIGIPKISIDALGSAQAS